MKRLRGLVILILVAAIGCEAGRFPEELPQPNPTTEVKRPSARVGTCSPPADVLDLLQRDAGAQGSYCGCVKDFGYGPSYPPNVTVENCVAKAFAAKQPFFVVYTVSGLVDGHMAPSFTGRVGRGSKEIAFYTFYPGWSQRVTCLEPELPYRRITCKQPKMSAS